LKKLLQVIMALLAINFLAVGAGIGWLVHTNMLDKEKIHAIKEIVFPATTQASTTQPSDEASATTKPSDVLQALLAKSSGRTPTEQIETLQRNFDAQMAQLDRRERELADLQRQVDLSKQQMARDRTALDAEKKALDAQKQQTAKLASDKGFQDSLALYNSMQGKQVKQIFMSMSDDEIVQYLQAMEPRAASRIVKEFKSPQELARIQKVMEKMRQAQASTSTKE
jgi:flagellar motility protein MotE (MotC chaperone)